MIAHARRSIRSLPGPSSAPRVAHGVRARRSPATSPPGGIDVAEQHQHRDRTAAHELAIDVEYEVAAVHAMAECLPRAWFDAHPFRRGFSSFAQPSNIAKNALRLSPSKPDRLLAGHGRALTRARRGLHEAQASTSRRCKPPSQVGALDAERIQQSRFDRRCRSCQPSFPVWARWSVRRCVDPWRSRGNRSDNTLDRVPRRSAPRRNGRSHAARREQQHGVTAAVLFVIDLRVAEIERRHRLPCVDGRASKRHAHKKRNPAEAGFPSLVGSLVRTSSDGVQPVTPRVVL